MSTKAATSYVHVGLAQVRHEVFEAVCDLFPDFSPEEHVPATVWAYLAQFNARFSLPGKDMSLSFVKVPSPDGLVERLEFWHYETNIVSFCRQKGTWFYEIMHGGFGPRGVCSRTTARRIDAITGYLVFSQERKTYVRDPKLGSDAKIEILAKTPVRVPLR